MEATLRQQATQAATILGFSSLQEATRVILHNLAQGQITISVEPTTQLSKQAIKRYSAMEQDFIQNKNISTYKNADEMLTKLGYANHQNS